MQQQKHPKAEVFIDAARELIGVPWKHMGRDKLGVDCVGMVLYAGKACGAYPVDYQVPEYPMGPDRVGMLKHLQLIMRRTMQQSVGCVVVFLSKDLTHLGIMTAKDRIIHADQEHGYVVEHIFSKPWSDYPHTFWELK